MLRGAKKICARLVVEAFGSHRQAGGRPWHANEVTDPNDLRRMGLWEIAYVYRLGTENIIDRY